MPATLLDGKRLAQTLQVETSAAAPFAQTLVRPPGLAAVLVGDNPASQTDVRNKRKQCAQVGIESWLHELPKDTSQRQLLDLIGRLNAVP